ncbi:aminopeptidase P family protein [Corynebacterium spheniscorum]|uniref:Xaa-Pro aminopeptidase n=1 Tax=Corynebacterium spheniscorum TaxID=185761 RepID=A0A1I2TLB0_9CORY|nr:aminopeptidase P family protein [Corynebacterium spheniscorum]KAA8724343.1 aminopeptidase P family protein [Corynebacterium spheniscorum]SFG65670.1 Xaa-Pro aminopeptidase [Corynebacterium spheniscorum]
MALADTRFLTRRRALAAALAGQRIDSMLVTHLTHVRYLSGFSGSNAALLLNKDLSAEICTDGRYTTQIAEEVPDIEALIDRPSGEALLRRIKGPRRIGFEADFVSVSQLEKFRKVCDEDVELVPVSGEIEAIRIKKDPIELRKLREVAELASQAFQDMLDAGELAVGRSEIVVAADLEYRMRKLGAERPSFDTIVASGPNSAKPHHGASDRIIEAGDLVTIDFGAHLAGFNSDMTRTLVMDHTTDFTKEIYEVVLRAQLAGVEAATPGTNLVDVDAACRDIIESAGYGKYFVHSTGHGVGLDVHEAPAAAQRSTGVLEENMTLTIEPGIYVPGKGGVRIEDTLIIRSGAPEIITKGSKDLTVL